ncbi:MAG: hypothetical protein N3E51_00440 [Candidatus Micrarchaeota archaeon]|nr:hypothetical protein [Candidatus Micrarchaeota archaeon]
MAETTKKKELIFNLYPAVQTEWILRDLQEQQEAMKKQAREILTSALSQPKLLAILKEEKSEIFSLVQNLNKLNITGVKVAKETEYVFSGSKKQKTEVDVYSLRVWIGGEEKIITLRVGPDFTEFSLSQNDKVSEVLQQKEQKITFQRFG